MKIIRSLSYVTLIAFGVCDTNYINDGLILYGADLKIFKVYILYGHIV